jgi:hypothetical protein
MQTTVSGGLGAGWPGQWRVRPASAYGHHYYAAFVLDPDGYQDRGSNQSNGARNFMIKILKYYNTRNRHVHEEWNPLFRHDTAKYFGGTKDDMDLDR